MARNDVSFIFDLDGTLVDSVYQHVMAWQEALQDRAHRSVDVAHSSPYRNERRARHRHAAARSRYRDQPGIARQAADSSQRSVRPPGAVRPPASGRAAIARAPDPNRDSVGGRDQRQHGRGEVQPRAAGHRAEAGSRHHPPGREEGQTRPRSVSGGRGPAAARHHLRGHHRRQHLGHARGAARARGLGVGVLSGGYGQDELERAGAIRVYEDPEDLLRHIDEIGGRA